MADHLPSSPAFGEIPPPPRWLARRRSRRLVGRLVVGFIAGIFAGIAISNSLADDRREGAALTKEKYLADFDAHKQSLMDSEDSTVAYVLVGAVAVLAMSGLYEIGGIFVAPAVGWVDEFLARRAAVRRGHVLDDTDD